jgi:hypothetical protein
MKVAIMQPYFLPYIGYYQLISAVDAFVVYDNIKYTKKGWINRNRMLQNGKDVMFSLPIKGASDDLDVIQRELSADFKREKLINQFKGAYSRAPQFIKTFPIIEEIIRSEHTNLFEYLHQSILKTCVRLKIHTEIIVSSTVQINHSLTGQEKVLALCEALGADTYINAIGGIELYSKEIFQDRKIDLRFIKSKPFEYAQFGDPFVPWLSILDTLMFNPIESLTGQIHNGFELI